MQTGAFGSQRQQMVCMSRIPGCHRHTDVAGSHAILPDQLSQQYGESTVLGPTLTSVGRHMSATFGGTCVCHVKRTGTTRTSKTGTTLA